MNKTFKELGLSPQFIEILEKNKIIVPTEIQEKAIPLAMKRIDIIGVSSTGSIDVGNTSYGLMLSGGDATYNKVGAAIAGYGNVISGNGSYGIYLTSAPRNDILGNYVGINSDGDVVIQNTTYNIYLDGTSTLNRISCPER